MKTLRRDVVTFVEIVDEIAVTSHSIGGRCIWGHVVGITRAMAHGATSWLAEVLIVAAKAKVLGVGDAVTV